MTKIEKRRIVFQILLMIFLVILLISSYKVYLILTDSKSTKNNLIYTNKSDVSYKINIDENEFIKANDLAKYDTYISSLVQDIDLTLKYQYQGSEKLPIDVKHRVIATIYGLFNETPNNQSANPVMWRREFILVDYQNNKYESTDQFQIIERVNLDWRLYNEEVIRFMANLSLPTISHLEVNLEVDFNGSNEKYNLTEKQVINAKMPLNQQVFNISALKDNSIEKFVSSNDIEELNREQRKLTAYIILTISSLLLILITIKQILVSKEKQPYLEVLEELKKNYDEIIVETKNMVEVKGLKTVTITSFDELLNLADSLLLPIMLYQESSKAIFYIVKDDMIFIFMIKNKHHQKYKNEEIE